MINALIALVVAGAFLFLVLKLMARIPAFSMGGARTRNIIDQIASKASEHTQNGEVPPDDEDIVASYVAEATGIAKFLFKLPGAEEFYLLLLKAGHASKVQTILWGMVALFVVLSVIFFKPFNILGVIPAAAIAWFFPRFIFRREINKRNIQFIDMFPEAIDMIVRSVKSGHPLNTALRMIGDNMDPPIGTEFKQVINEVSYGRPLVEALRRLAKRIDEPDVHFFVVVLSVQQETGGNLAEILGNLSNVIRGRKQLNQKIRAMTSEGRATAWILGALPVVQFGAILITSPDYLDPLFQTLVGNVILAIAISLIAMAMWIINRMIDVDI